jgi:hypothetical protein
MSKISKAGGDKDSDQDGLHSRTSNEALRVHRHTWVEMNRSVYTARRNAAHERLTEILLRDIRNQPKERRFKYYKLCTRLIDGILSDTIRSQVLPDSPLVHYLRLLRSSIQSAMSLLHHDISLEHESAKFVVVLGREVVQRFQAHSAIFIENEQSILKSTDDMLSFGLLLLDKDYAERRESFTQDDFRRYDKAYQEYRRHYWDHQPEME